MKMTEPPKKICNSCRFFVPKEFFGTALAKCRLYQFSLTDFNQDGEYFRPPHSCKLIAMLEEGRED
jgi:hypothetical protein